MHTCRGSTLRHVRALVQALGGDALSRFEAGLSPAARKTLAADDLPRWKPAPAVAEVLEHAAAVIYPADDQGLRRLGAVLAEQDMRTFNRTVVGITTPAFVLGQMARLWPRYHGRGEACVVKHPSGRRAELVVSGAPELPSAFLEEVAGYLETMVRLAGAKNPVAQIEDRDPRAWRWIITWT